MKSASAPTLALEYLQKRLPQCQGETLAALRGLLALISPARPDSAEALGRILLESGIWARMEPVVATLAYNPDQAALGTPEAAIQRVGMERVHKLAVSLLLHRSFRLQVSAEAQEDVEVLALASGFLARELARRQENCDPDFGMICALLRNFGRLVTASVLREQSVQARTLAVALDEDDRYVAIFGLTPFELSHHLVLAGELPNSLAARLAGAPSYLTTAASFTYEDEIIRLTDFALKACALSELTEGESEAFSVRADRLIEDLDMPQSLRGWDVETMLVAVVQQLAGRGAGDAMTESRSLVLAGLRHLCQNAVS